MNTVKEYKGHKVPEGAQRVDANGRERLRFLRKVSRHVEMFDGTSGWLPIPFTYEWPQGSVDLPQEKEQYMPKVGEWCEHLADEPRAYYGKLFLVGMAVADFYVMEAKGGTISRFPTSVEFRPIKTDREKVIEAAMGKMNGISGYHAKGLSEQLFDAEMLIMPEPKE